MKIAKCIHVRDVIIFNDIDINNNNNHNNDIKNNNNSRRRLRSVTRILRISFNGKTPADRIIKMHIIQRNLKFDPLYNMTRRYTTEWVAMLRMPKNKKNEFVLKLN